MTTYENTSMALHSHDYAVDEESVQKFVTFRLGPGYFAVPITDVQEIVYDLPITKLPVMAPFLAGVIELRGEVINVINLKKRLRLSCPAASDTIAFVVIRYQDTLLALQADAIGEVIGASDNELEPLPVAVHCDDEELLTHVIKTGNGLVTLMHPQNLIHHYTSIITEENSMANTLFQSQRAHSAQAVTETVQLVTFSIGNDEYAVNIKDVQEINKISAITHVPRAPKFVEGVINLRGQVLPVINLRERFNLSKSAYDKNTRVIVIQLEDKRLGLIVDAVSEVLRIPLPAVKQPPAEAVGEDAGFVSGIAEWNKRLIIVLNLEKVLSHDEVSDLGNVRDSIEETLTEPSNN